MEAAELTQADFWDEAATTPVVLGNPQCEGDLEAVASAAGSVAEISGHVIIETSGSGGASKFACLSRRALGISARAVNGHLKASPADRWLCALPTFHVGGLGIYARAFHSGSEVFELYGGWDPLICAARIEDVGVTLSSMVPTQVVDLVRAGIAAPASLRAVIVGGGALPARVVAAARGLGWPLLQSYGMTEAASQIATQPIEPGRETSAEMGLPILPHWEVRSASDGRLEIRGDSLFSGYFFLANQGSAGHRFEPALKPGDEGWFKTSDLGKVENRSLKISGRADRVVKILGELVDVDAVERAFVEFAEPGIGELVCVESVGDVRRGSRLVIVAAAEVEETWLESLRLNFNEQAPALERIDAVHRVEHLPRSPLGKIRRQELRRLARLR